MAIMPAFARALGEIRAEFAAVGARTEVARVYESGGLRMRFPRVASGCEAVIINTGGGVAGGDRSTFDLSAGPGAAVTLTTQSAEKIYRAQSDPSEINVSLRLAPGARLEWLPQETILFDGARLLRRLDVDMHQDSTLTLVESLTFGRLAMGETQIEGLLRDRWRIRRDRRLIFAEDLRLDGDIAGALDRPAVGREARATATLLHVAPKAEESLDLVRSSLADAPCEWGASAWNDMIVARLLSPSPEKLRAGIIMVLQALRGQAAPRVWQ